ncbi:MAG: alginate export family protein [Chthoniobacteraceae bacterium]
MKQPHPRTSRRHTLLAMGVLSPALLAPAFAGPEPAPLFAAPKPAEAPLLSFFDGALAFDLEERLRFEVRSNNLDFNEEINDDNDDTWLINRFRLGVAIKPASWLKLYAQGQDTREWDSKRPNYPGARGNEGGDDFDLRQAYVELSDYRAFPLGITVGRQALTYGDSRLVADSKWTNPGRTFDAVKVRLQTEKLWVDAFAARVVQIKEHVFNDSDSADNFYGIYASTDLLSFQTTDFYFFYRDKEDNQPDLAPTNTIDPRGTANGSAQRVNAIGTRWKSAKGLQGWDYNVEAVYEFGETWTGDRTTPRSDLHAFASHISGGYTFNEVAWKPRLGVGYNYASGDKDPTDSKNESFQTLYPSNHAKFGDMDEFAWRNIHNLRAQLTVKPAKTVELELTYNADWLANTHDYWYRGGSALRTTTSTGQNVRTIGADSFAGHELDFIARWKPTKWLNLDAGYAHFFAGNYLRDTGPSDDADFGYVQAQLLF